MAAPHVSGVFALMKRERPNLDYGMAKAWLESGALTVSEGGRTQSLGWGVIDASKSVSTASTGLPATVLSPSPALISLSSEGAPRSEVRLSVFGPGTVRLLDVSAKPNWLSIELIDDDEQVGGELRVQLLPENLPPTGAVRGEVRLAYTVDNEDKELVIPAVVEVVSDEVARDAGRHFVLLVNTEPDVEGRYNAVSQVSVDASSGAYKFRFEADDGVEPRRLSEVVPGTYYLVAGTDLDGDGLICQSGEACAEYPVTGLREVIEIVEGDVTSDIRMTTSFSRPTISTSTPDILPRPGFKGYKLLETSLAPSTNDGAKAVQ
jgi:serine protease